MYFSSDRKKVLKVFNATIVIDDNHTQVVSSFFPQRAKKKCKLETRMTLGPDFLENKFSRSLKFSSKKTKLQFFNDKIDQNTILPSAKWLGFFVTKLVKN